MKVIITGATGLVGAEVVRQAMVDKNIHEITLLVRREPVIPFLPEQGKEKLRIVIHKDFLDYSAPSELFKTQDACIWCLGISQNQVSKDEYHTITYDYTIAAAKAMLAANPSITFLFVSGEGADPTEKSRFLFGRVKGKTENALNTFPFKRLLIVRPAGIKPIHRNPNSPWSTRLFAPLFPIFEVIAPNSVISSVELARVILRLVEKGSDKILLRNTDLREIVLSL